MRIALGFESDFARERLKSPLSMGLFALSFYEVAKNPARGGLPAGWKGK